MGNGKGNGPREFDAEDYIESLPPRELVDEARKLGYDIDDVVVVADKYEEGNDSVTVGSVTAVLMKDDDWIDAHLRSICIAKRAMTKADHDLLDRVHAWRIGSPLAR